MLATLVIGLREGLEASLIVGIIAAFLRRNGASLVPMWIGTGLAILLSALVGLGLSLVESALPQARQEALETVIGAIAILFVTGMILWMDRHAADMKRGIEAEAAAALGAGDLGRTRTIALACMAFLAVLKEGFETSVFLLATFSAAQSAAWAAAGAAVGLILAVIIGWAIYVGGIRINLSRFFRVTGAFLILVAAGLCVTALRTAHEAGWLNAGQQLAFNLSWLVQPGTIRAALITGVLGIPADPRRIEVIGWCAYLIPVVAMVYWPARLRPGTRVATLLRGGIALALCLLAAGLFHVPRPRLRTDAPVPLLARHSDMNGTARLAGDDGIALTWGAHSLRVSMKDAGTDARQGVTARLSRAEVREDLTTAPDSVSFDDLVTLSGGRRPIGLNPARYPGPYAASWQVIRHVTSWRAHDMLLDLQGDTDVTVTLSGGGLSTPRSLRLRSLPPELAALTGPLRWQADPAYVTRSAAALARQGSAVEEWQFWSRKLPIFLLALALWAAFRAGAGLMRARRLSPERFSTFQGARAEDPAPKGF